MRASASSNPLAPVTAGARIGRYELIGELGHGGMGVVYLCRHAGEAGFQRLFALKMMHDHLTNDVEFVSMFLDEARIAARIHHHNVVSILDLGSWQGRHYVVLEYVEGPTLSRVLRRTRGHLPPRAVVPMMLDTLEGLHAAHMLTDDDGATMGLVHRDVSPTNVLVGSDGVSRITDFGVAKATSRIASTRPGVHKGKLAYSAPERLRGEEDARVDVFAAGVVMWAALAGRDLFATKDEASTVYNLLHMPIPRPSETELAPPACLDDICLRALARDPAERYQSAGEMAKDLRAVAVANDLLGGPADVMALIQGHFTKDLERRRSAIRAAQALPPSGERSDSKADSLPAMAQQSTPSSRPVSEAELEIEVASARPTMLGKLTPPSRLRWILAGGALVAGALVAILLWSGGRGGRANGRPLEPGGAATKPVAAEARPGTTPAGATGPAAAPTTPAVPSRGTSDPPAAAAAPTEPAAEGDPPGAVVEDAPDRADAPADRARKRGRDRERSQAVRPSTTPSTRDDAGRSREVDVPPVEADPVEKEPPRDPRKDELRIEPNPYMRGK